MQQASLGGISSIYPCALLLDATYKLQSDTYIVLRLLAQNLWSYTKLSANEKFQAHSEKSRCILATRLSLLLQCSLLILLTIAVYK